jgi:transposase
MTGSYRKHRGCGYIIPRSNPQRTIAALREKLRRKDEVVSELMEEHVQLKKGLGGL